MDWIRRNWPDLLIGLALLAVIAGIIATLLNGGSFLPGRTSAPPAATTQTQTNDPADATTADPNTADPNTADSNTDLDTTGSGPAPAATEDAPVDTAEAGTTPQTSDVPVIPSNSENASAETEDSAPVADITTTSLAESPAVAEPAPASDTTTSDTTTSDSTDTAAAPDAAPSVVTAADVESSYRVLVGSFGNADNALRRAQELEEADLPAFTATQDNLNLVLVGPFDTRAEADDALNRVRSEVPDADPLLFEPATSTATTETTPAEAVTEAVAPTPAPPAVGGEGPSETGGENFLQTGAYGSSASAQPQRERLESLGFNVSEVQEGSFVKLLVGPFSADELGDAQSRLSAQGIEHFVRSN